tara:strand:- start:117 stop:1325 length:1209 start_codon:yes stop_codon:yes gene_type:complete
MISYSKAVSEIRKNVKQSKENEFVNLSFALNRILADNIHSDFDSPISNISSMDGAIIRKIDLNKTNKFKIVGESKAGDLSTTNIGKNETKFVYTGGPVPGIGKIVIPKENFTISKNKKTLEIIIKPKINFIRKKGQDFKVNDLCLKNGDILNVRKLALAKALKRKKILVKKKPKIAVIITGDEIKSKKNPKGLIESSNKILIVNILEMLGCNITEVHNVGDKKAELTNKLNSLTDYDFLITSGGISKGKYDIVKSTLKDFNLKIIFDKVKVKPGKPITFGILKKNRYFLGTPGNPVSCFIAIIFFFTKMLNSYYGQKNKNFYCRSLISNSSYEITNNFTNFLRIKLKDSENNFDIFQNQDSSLLGVLSESDGILILQPSIRKIVIGEEYKVILFRDILNLSI